jgi:hypothetical protein
VHHAVGERVAGERLENVDVGEREAHMLLVHIEVRVEEV